MGASAGYGAPPGFPNRLNFNDSANEIPSLTNQIVVTKKEVKPENEDKKEKDEEKEVKIKMGMEHFMSQQRDFSVLTELINESEKKFNNLNTLVCTSQVCVT